MKQPEARKTQEPWLRVIQLDVLPSQAHLHIYVQRLHIQTNDVSHCLESTARLPVKLATNDLLNNLAWQRPGQASIRDVHSCSEDDSHGSRWYCWVTYLLQQQWQALLQGVCDCKKIA